MKKTMEKTVYGKKKAGESMFVVIAPHAAGDDLRSGKIAAALAKKLKAFLVVNKRFYKLNNSHCRQELERIEDFNKLKWSAKRQKYLWKGKKPAMKVFFKDVEEFNRRAREFSAVKKAVNIYIHSFLSKVAGIDIGSGIRPGKYNRKLFGSKKHFSVGCNSGAVTVKIGTVKQMQKMLEKEIKKHYNLSVTIGANYSGWSNQSAIQFHKHEDRNDYALQLEISQQLRETDKDIARTVGIIEQALKQIFNK